MMNIRQSAKPRACLMLLSVCVAVFTTTNAFTAPPRAWPDGVVYFEFDGGVTSSEREYVRRAMDDWSKTSADVVFLPRNGLTTVPYVFIRHSTGGNNADLGAPSAGYNTYLNLNNTGFNGPWFPAHELGHVLGFHHEQSRPDRNSYVYVATSNLDDPNDSNYDIVSASDFIYNTSTSAFNYDSIMLYAQCFNSKCSGTFASCPNELECSPYGGRTMVKADGSYTLFVNKWGPKAYSDNNEELYSVDINRAIEVYGSGQVRYLDNGSSDASNGTLEKPYNTLSDARLNSPLGARVYVNGNTYTGTPATFDRQLTWRAYPNTTVEIR